METAGKYWAAEKVEGKRGNLTVSALNNQSSSGFRSVILFPIFYSKGGYRNISNQYSITTQIDKEHPGMREYAKDQGWWDGDTPFSFAGVYSFVTTSRLEAAGSRYCEGKRLLEKSSGNVIKTVETAVDLVKC